MAVSYRTSLALLAIAAFALVVSASDPDPVADFVVPGVNATAVNGANFVLRALNNVTVPAGQGSNTKSANVASFPALTSQGISYTYINYAPCGQNPIHTHPRATELLFVMSGQLYAGFVDTNNQLYSTTLNPGDVFVFPRGLVHFQQNISPTNPATALAALNSQNPGTQRIGSTLFLPTGVPTSIEQVAFNAQASTIEGIKANFPASGNPVGTGSTGCGGPAPAATFPFGSP